MPLTIDTDVYRNPLSYSQATEDVSGENILNARAIGTLTADRTRLTVVSALTNKDRVDHFSFRLSASTQVGLTLTTSRTDDESVVDTSTRPPVRVEVLQNGRVIADSEATSGDLKTAYDKMRADKFDMAAGNYVLRTTRETGGDVSKSPSYAIQLSAGKFSKDYDTVETPASEFQKTSISTSTGTSIANMVGDAQDPRDGYSYNYYTYINVFDYFV
ncbi:MAG: hypothetical protein IPI58_00950 [Alphaproteobacteria bacterium]|nr:MAG: hypothetical protein IPI58_00950 [Alphaproteobacteria bacterium]